MTRERYRFAVILVALITQIVGGILAFGLVPQAIFTNIGSNELAQVCLRLAVYSNVSMAVVIALVLVYAPEPRLLRWLAAGGVFYHLLAGIDSVLTAVGLTSVALADPVFGPTIFHSVMFLILLTAVLIPEREPAPRHRAAY